MNPPSDNDSLEKLLREQPLDQVPAGVYERLQKKAAWNQTPAAPWPLLLGLIAGLAIIVFVLFQAPSQEKPKVTPTGSVTPIMIPTASAPVVALARPTEPVAFDDDLSRQVGGLSIRFMANEPPFALRFGAEIDRSSIRREGLES
jgi:hypothetical protein